MCLEKKTNEQPQCFINISVKVVNTVGKEKAIELFNETKKMEADGGMLVHVSKHELKQ